MNADLLRFILDHPLFNTLRESSLKQIYPCFHSVRVPSHETLFHEGDKYDGFYIVRSGKLSIRQKTEWGEREICVVKSPDVFGEMEVLERKRRFATVLAIEDSDCIQIAPEGFDKLFELEPTFALNITKALVKRIKEQDIVVSTELYRAYRALTFALANLTDSRDPETGMHLFRTRTYCAVLAEKLSAIAEYKGTVTTDFIDRIYNLSPMHDIGKVAVPDAILLKPTLLTLEEFEIMKTHTTVGALAFDQALRESDNDIFRMGKRICLHHHEKWDGSGYPKGLKKLEIPIEARIMALADVYEALLSKRTYKRAYSFAESELEIQKGIGTAFDPKLTEIMLDNIKLFMEIHNKYKDDE